MTEDIKNKLLMCAEMYHRADFIQSDPVQFPHRYTLKQDIEVSGLLTAIMSFGNRKQILKKAEELHGLMGDSPYQYVLSRQWEGDFPPGATGSFYRMLSHADFYGYFQRLYIAYTQSDAETFSLKNARQITVALAEVFPDDPCLGDFALFGLGVNGEI